tara:strand:- start:2792 stop:3628 length:837 start_codon:yes stop_codon:yes gene_type:complete
MESDDYGAAEPMAEEAAPSGAPAERERALSSKGFSETAQEKKEQNAQEGTMSVLPLDVSEEASGRMLEYTINLSFSSNSILASRDVVFEAARKYGFLSSSRTYSRDNSHFQATIRVDSQRLYDALKELEKTGNLWQSSVDVTDHTADMVWESIKLDRERLRSIRRQGLANRTGPREQTQVENLISGSEDNLDRAKFEKWKIQDRVQWATVNITVDGPEATQEIKVPAYQNALIGLTNSFLSFTYWLLENLLWLAVLAVIAWKWKSIWNAARRLVGKDQ